MVIFLFLRNVWATMIPSITVPVALVCTFAVMYLLGYSLDNLSLMALTIAVGFVVDDAIVMLENIYRHIEEGMKPMEAALKGAGEIGFTIVSISLSLIAVFIPLLLMGGIVGRLFREFAMTVDHRGGGLGDRLADPDADDVLALPAPPRRQARPALPHHRGVLRRLLIGFYRRTLDIALRFQLHHAAGVLRHDGADRASSTSTIPKGFFPPQDTGVMIGITEGGAGHLVRRDGAAAGEARRRRRRGSRRRRLSPPSSAQASAARPATTAACSSP